MARVNIYLYEHSYLVDLIWIICYYPALVETSRKKESCKNWVEEILFLTKQKWKTFDRKKNIEYRISSNKGRVSKKRLPLISAAPVGIHIEASASL